MKVDQELTLRDVSRFSPPLKATTFFMTSPHREQCSVRNSMGHREKRKGRENRVKVRETKTRSFR